ncbi:MAG: ribonuclease P protein component [bacterium]
MLPRQHRLTRERDIRHLLRGGRVARGRVLQLRSRYCGGGTLRFTVVVSTRVSKKAVIRNRLRRQVRALLQHRLPRLPRGYDFLISILARNPLPTYDDFRRDLNHFFSADSKT